MVEASVALGFAGTTVHKRIVVAEDVLRPIPWQICRRLFAALRSLGGERAVEQASVPALPILRLALRAAPNAGHRLGDTLFPERVPLRCVQRRRLSRVWGSVLAQLIGTRGLRIDLPPIRRWDFPSLTMLRPLLGRLPGLRVFAPQGLPSPGSDDPARAAFAAELRALAATGRLTRGLPGDQTPRHDISRELDVWDDGLEWDVLGELATGAASSALLERSALAAWRCGGYGFLQELVQRTERAAPRGLSAAFLPTWRSLAMLGLASESRLLTTEVAAQIEAGLTRALTAEIQPHRRAVLGCLLCLLQVEVLGHPTDAARSGRVAFVDARRAKVEPAVRAELEAWARNAEALCCSSQASFDRARSLCHAAAASLSRAIEARGEKVGEPLLLLACDVCKHLSQVESLQGDHCQWSALTDRRAALKLKLHPLSWPRELWGASEVRSWELARETCALQQILEQTLLDFDVERASAVRQALAQLKKDCGGRSETGEATCGPSETALHLH